MAKSNCRLPSLHPTLLSITLGNLFGVLRAALRCVPYKYTEGLPGCLLKAARQTTGWSVSETEFKTKGYEEALFTATNQPVPKDVGISATTVNRYERGKLDNLDWRSLSLLCFVLKPIDPVTGEALEPTNALYIACEHPPYNDAKLYE